MNSEERNHKKRRSNICGLERFTLRSATFYIIANARLIRADNPEANEE
jgi:hypothetical protein